MYPEKNVGLQWQYSRLVAAVFKILDTLGNPDGRIAAEQMLTVEPMREHLEESQGTNDYELSVLPECAGLK